MAFDPAKFGKWAYKALQIDEATISRARKVAALYRRGATGGERAAAWSRLEASAAAANTDAATLLRCC